jgi:SAM-dependent methyltransferase
MIHKRMPKLLRALPEGVQRRVLHFESEIENAVRAFAATLPPGSAILDAGAGELQYASLFESHQYVAVDLGVGDSGWSYERLDVLARLEHLPFPDEAFDGCLNIVTLEHVTDPVRVLSEICRVLRPGGALLLVTPLEWEEHQAPHDYFRYTQYGLRHLLQASGLRVRELRAAGGLFRVLARRLLNAGQALPLLMPFVAGRALLLPSFDRFDRDRRFTLGHICTAYKP